MNKPIGQHREREALPVFRENLLEYGKDTVRSKIPHIVDGLKLVQRRLLLANRTFKGSFPLPKVASLTGNTILLYHPHSDYSISDTAIRMAQPHLNMITLFNSPSNVGDYSGGCPASPRYFEIEDSEFGNWVFFDGVNTKLTPHQPNEIGNGVMEPSYLVPKLPTSLLVSGSGIGFGHSSEPGLLSLYQIIYLVKQMTKVYQTGGWKVHRTSFIKKAASWLVPDFPTYQYIRNYTELIKGYKKEHYIATLVLDGKMDISPTKVIIRNLPYGVNPKDVWFALGKELDNSKPNWVNTNFVQISDYGEGAKQCCLELTLKRGVDVFSILDELKNRIGFTRTWTPRYLFTTPNEMATYVDPIVLLILWYDLRVRSIQGNISLQERKIVKELRAIEALLIIGKDIKKVVDLIVKAKDNTEALKNLCHQYKLSMTQATAVMDYKLGNLAKADRKELLERYEQLQSQMNKLHDEYLNPHGHIFDDMVEAEKKFSAYKSRNSHLSQFIGYLTTSTGWIQFVSIEELKELVQRFPEYTGISMYTKTVLESPPTMFYRNTKHRVTLPKEMQYTQSYVELEGTETIVWSVTGKIGRISGRHLPINATVRGIVVQDRVIVVRQSGSVEVIDSSTIPSTDSIERPSNDSDIVFVSPYIQGTLSIAYSNRVNEVEIVTLNPGTSLTLLSRATVLAIGSTTDPLSIPLLDRCKDKCALKHIVLTTPTPQTIKLNSRSFKKPYTLVETLLIGE